MLWGKRRLCLSGCILIFFGSAAGCGNVQKDTDHIVILEQEQEKVLFLYQKKLLMLNI